MATQTIGNLAEASTTLRQLDRREWSRLVAALFLILMLTAGIAGVSLPNWSAITEAPEMELRVQVILIGGFAEPFHSFGSVNGNAFALDV